MKGPEGKYTNVVRDTALKALRDLDLSGGVKDRDAFVEELVHAAGDKAATGDGADHIFYHKRAIEARVRRELDDILGPLL